MLREEIVLLRDWPKKEKNAPIKLEDKKTQARRFLMLYYPIPRKQQGLRNDGEE